MEDFGNEQQVGLKRFFTIIGDQIVVSAQMINLLALKCVRILHKYLPTSERISHEVVLSA